MRGASRISLAEASEQLSAAASSKATSDQIGDDLFAVSRLLDGQPGLRRALTDPARPPAAKAELVHALLDGKVSGPAVELMASLVAARWSVPRDLADATEELGARAVVIGAEQSSKLDDLEDDLFRFGRVVSGQPELRSALTNPQLPADRKRGLLGALLDGKATPAAERLITQAVLEPRGRSLDTALDSYAKLAAARKQRLVAVVRVASPLSGQQVSRLTTALSSLYGHDVHLNLVEDPAVVGGMSIQIGDEYIDASVASRLAALHRKLTG